MSKFFKPEDFKERMNIGDPFERMADVANHKLEREGKVAYTYGNQDRWIISGNVNIASHKALLINIEPIEKCSHPVEKVTFKRHNQNPAVIIWDWICECGAKVKPKEFEAIND